MSVYDPYSSGGDGGMTGKKPPKPDTAWMLTVADLFSLMLTFFVLLYSMSVLQRDRWEDISESLMQRLQVIRDEETPLTLTEDWQVPRAEFTFARGLDYLNKVITDRFAKAENMEGVVITKGKDRITLSLTSDSMFNPGSAMIEPEARPALMEIGQFLGHIGNAITIEGHTDPRPISTSSFPSNWELSMARAVNVANALREAGYPYAIDIYGKGSSRYSDLTNLPNDEREMMARRVDIIVRETVAKY